MPIFTVSDIYFNLTFACWNYQIFKSQNWRQKQAFTLHGTFRIDTELYLSISDELWCLSFITCHLSLWLQTNFCLYHRFCLRRSRSRNIHGILLWKFPLPSMTALCHGRVWSEAAIRKSSVPFC